MDKTPIHQDIIVQRITAIDNPMRAAFLHKKNTLVINSRDGIYEVNYKENRKTADMIPNNRSKLCAINQQRDAVAVITTFDSEGVHKIFGEIKLYDVKKQKLTWRHFFTGKPFNPSCIFTPSGILYVIEEDGNVHSSDDKSYYFPEAKSGHKGIITADNEAEKIIFTKYVNDSASALNTIHFDINRPVVTTDLIPNIPCDTVNAQIHNPKNKIVALHYYFNKIWILYDRINKTAVTTAKKLMQHCCSFDFHPKKESLLAMLTKDGFVEIYDFRKDKTIARTYNSLWVPTSDSPIKQTSINFSEDGENIVVTVGTERYVDKNVTFDYRCLVLSNLYPQND